MQRTNKFLMIVLTFVLLVLITNFTVVAAEKEIILHSPPTVAVLPVLWMEENELLGADIDLTVKISPDLNRANALIAKGDIDLMITGVNVGAKIFNKGIDVKLMDASIWAIDYLLTRGVKIDSWPELKGMTLGLPLKGGPLDFLARYFLRENGVDPTELQLVYKPLANGARSFQLGQLDAIILPEPLLTVTLNKTDDVFLSLDLNEEWAKLHHGEGRIPYVGLFVSGKLVEQDPALVREINQLYKKGVNWVNNNPEKAAALGAKYFNMPAPVIKASFTRINLNCYPHEERNPLIELYFNEIMEIYPEMIGGKLPDESFYF